MSQLFNTQYVDEKYSAIIEPNLYYDSVLVPGVTFDNRYEEQAGGIFIHKLGTSGFIAPTTPGSDYTHATVADTLIQAVFNNEFDRSREVRGVTASSVAYNKAEAELAEAIQEVKQGWMLSGLACLAFESTDASDTTALSISNMETQFLGDRAALVTAKAKPDFALMSPAAYNLTLQVAGDNYRPVANERIIGMAGVGMWYGLNVIECNGFSETVVTYYDHSGTLITYNLSAIDYIMGDHRAFSVLDSFSALRLIESTDFPGSYAQVTFNTAYRVTNSACVLTKYNGAPTA